VYSLVNVVFRDSQASLSEIRLKNSSTVRGNDAKQLQSMTPKTPAEFIAAVLVASQGRST
jgi:hypothetical protein